MPSPVFLVPKLGVVYGEVEAAKRQSEHDWRKTKNEFNWTWVRSTIKAYFVAVKGTKCHYWSGLIASQNVTGQSYSSSLGPSLGRRVLVIIYRTMQRNLLNT